MLRFGATGDEKDVVGSGERRDKVRSMVKTCVSLPGVCILNRG